jgi:uncharacterized protein YndB with AHSA1/START domain
MVVAAPAGHDIRGRRTGGGRVPDPIGFRCIGVRGEFVELDPPASMRMTWIWLDDGRAAAPEDVRIDFKPAAGGTDVRVVHECSADPDDLRQGWTDVLARLARTA